MMLIVVFVFGLIVGSFLNVVVLRLNTGEPIIRSRSKCFSCGHKLAVLDLIPLFSFLVQKGKCRYCQSKISFQYPLVELITGIVFLFVVLKITNYSLFITNYSLLLAIGYWLAVFSFLIAISVYDLHHQIIQDKFVYPFIGLALIPVVLAEKALFSHLLSGLSFFGFFALLWLVSRGKWIGFGDAKLALGLGFLLGPWNSLAAFLFSFWLGGLVGIFLMAFKKKKFNLKTQIPFGPFLVAGAFLSFLIGDKFIGLLFGL
ncbi:MAG: prepilin peptidase [Patescibacteria group bacterium]